MTDFPNKEENLTKNKHLCAMYYKGFKIDPKTGHISDPRDYYNFFYNLLNKNFTGVEEVEMVNNSKQVDPMMSLMILDKNNLIPISEAPTLSSDEMADEMIELYIASLIRDIPFTKLDPKYKNILYNQVSQFLYTDITNGYVKTAQLYSQHDNPKDYGDTRDKMMQIQQNKLETVGKCHLGFIYNGRSLAEAVNKDAVYQLFYQAANIMMGMGIKPNSGFHTLKNSAYFGLANGAVSSLCLIADVTAEALKQCWYYKWLVCRKLRPENVSIWVDNVKSGLTPNIYGLSNKLLNADVLKEIYDKQGNYLLSSSYNNSAPLHPSYPSGHACIAGACGTMLKILFNTNVPWTNAMVISDDGKTLRIISGSTTVDDELNKLIADMGYGRAWAGIHYRSDLDMGYHLGEKVAIKYFKEKVKPSLPIPVQTITIKSYFGNMITI